MLAAWSLTPDTVVVIVITTSIPTESHYLPAESQFDGSFWAAVVNSKSMLNNLNSNRDTSPHRLTCIVCRQAAHQPLDPEYLLA